QSVRPIRLLEISRWDRLGQPPIVRLARELQDPARHRDGNPVSGQLADERVDHFPRRFACDRYAAARRRTSFSCSSNLIRFRASRNSVFSAAVVPAEIPSSISAVFIQFARQDSLIPKSSAICLSFWPGSRLRATRTTSSRNSLG